MKKELSTKNEQLQNLVTKLLGKQAGKYTKLADLFKDIQADPATIEQAQKDIADDGYWGVEQTSDGSGIERWRYIQGRYFDCRHQKGI